MRIKTFTKLRGACRYHRRSRQWNGPDCMHREKETDRCVVNDCPLLVPTLYIKQKKTYIQ